MRKVLCFLIIGVFSGAYTTFSNFKEDELMMAQVIFRHGNRTFQKTYANDPYKDKIFWPEGFYHLTNEGKELQYKFGEFLRRRYGKFVGYEYSEEKVRYRSTDAERTLMSALTNAASFFQPTGHQIWNVFLNWQPVPVHTIPLQEDSLVYQSVACELADELFAALVASSQFSAFLDQYKDLKEYIDLNTGLRSTTNREILNNFYTIWDVLNVEHSRGLPLPVWALNVLQNHNDDLGHIVAVQFALRTQTTEMQKAKAGPLIKEIFDQFKDKTLSLLDPDRLLFMYSAHDNTIINTLNTLGVFDVNPIVPPYASSLHFEMYRHELGLDEHEYYIQLFYRTDKSEYLPPIHIPGCGTKCSLEKLYELFGHILPNEDESYEFLCHNENLQELIDAALASFTL